VQVTLDSFPLGIGHKWKYYTESHVVLNTGNSDAYFISSWEIKNDTIINGMTSAKMFRRDSSYSGTINRRNNFYANKPNGFYATATDAIGNDAVWYLRNKKQNFNEYLMQPFRYGINTIDTVLIPADTVLWLMKFPVAINDVWLSNEYGHQAHFKRKWDGYATITTGAGTFNCVKILLIFDADNNGVADANSPIVYQYFSAKGLIEEDMTQNLVSSGQTGTLTRASKLLQLNF